MSDTFGDAIKQVIQCCAESGGQAAMAACVVCEEIERLQQRLAAAEALLRAAVECGEWFDGTFHIEMNADWLDKAKEVCDEPL